MGGRPLQSTNRATSSAMPNALTPAEGPFEFDPALLLRGYSEGKFPLFVLGSGISAGLVPLLRQMTAVLVGMIKRFSQWPADITQLLLEKGKLIEDGLATRADAAEFFSLLQETEAHEKRPNLWQEFCGNLLYDGLTLDKVQYSGLLRQEKTSKAHMQIAKMAAVGACHVLNLNYDPLLYLAMKQLRLDCGRRDGLVPKIETNG